MSDAMITMRALKRILDTDRRLDIYPGPVKAPAAFFEKYGPRFIPYKPGRNEPEVQVITSWADKSRAVEFAEIRKAARIAAKREAAAVAQAAVDEVAAEEAAAGAEEGAEEVVEKVEAEAEVEEPEAEVEKHPKAHPKSHHAAAHPKAAVDDGKSLSPEKATWTGVKKLKKKA